MFLFAFGKYCDNADISGLSDKKYAHSDLNKDFETLTCC